MTRLIFEDSPEHTLISRGSRQKIRTPKCPAPFPVVWLTVEAGAAVAYPWYSPSSMDNLHYIVIVQLAQLSLSIATQSLIQSPLCLNTLQFVKLAGTWCTWLYFCATSLLKEPKQPLYLMNTAFNATLQMAHLASTGCWTSTSNRGSNIKTSMKIMHWRGMYHHGHDCNCRQPELPCHSQCILFDSVLYSTHTFQK